MIDFLRNLFDTTDFPARWHCGEWTSAHGWLHIISDLGVWSAYVAIPCVLAWFVLRRSDLPFQTVFWLFGAFILACGSTHLMEAAIFWWPAYRFAGVIKAFTAIVSWATVAVLIPTVPKALLLRSPEALEREVVERKKAEHALREMCDTLEKRVEERVAELAQSNQALEREITERTAAQGQALSANRMKDEFLATLSHELRTPLTAILGWAQLLRSVDRASPEVDHGLDVIERNAHTQVRIIEDLLDVSRIISGKLRLDVQSIDLAEVIHQALAAISPAADAKGVQVQSRFNPLPGAVRGDPARLQQVVWNLLSNAVKFTPKGGRINVNLEQVSSHIEISVADTGEGIEPDFLPYVFDRFRQSDSSTTRRHGGLGLGLAIVRQIVELHGGQVHVESAGRGCGAKFTVRLPMAAVQDHARLAPHPLSESDLAKKQTPVDLSGVRVLVVDDEPDARDLISRVLIGSHAEVQTAGSATEALELLKQYRPHILMSDIGMPERDGYDLIQEVRSTLTPKQMPAVALTAFARTEDKTRALEAGVQSHIVKPVDAGELTRVVANLANLS